MVTKKIFRFLQILLPGCYLLMTGAVTIAWYATRGNSWVKLQTTERPQTIVRKIEQLEVVEF